MTRLARVTLVTADLAAAEAFYRESFGFAPAAKAEPVQPPSLQRLALDGVRARSVVLALGRERLELVTYEPIGRSYPSASTANDGWFQHFSIVVADIAQAFDHLQRRHQTVPISTNGPQRLPPNTGGVIVYKFRDPEGHPIELTQFPPGAGAARWQAAHGSRNALGIDHSAISVADVARSLAFYEGWLGLRVAGRSLNRGVEQDRLDGLASACVDIVALQPAEHDSPHIELLAYHPPGRPAALLHPNDVAATRLVLEVQELSALLGRLPGSACLVAGPVTLPSGKAAALLRDPDGHLLTLTG